MNPYDDSVNAGAFDRHLQDAKARGVSDAQAMKITCQRYPELRAAWVRHANRAAGRPVASTT